MNNQPYYYNPFEQNDSEYNNHQNTVFMLQQEYFEEKKAIKKISRAIGLAIISFVLAQTFLVVMFGGFAKAFKIDVLNTPTFSYGMLIFTSILSVLVPFLIIAKSLKIKGNEILPNERLEKADIFWYTCLGTGLCMVANVITNFIVTILSSYGINLTQSEESEPKTLVSSFLFFVSIAVVPAIVEEIAMRGVVLHAMVRYGKVFAIVSSAFVFGILHGNLIQAPFAFMVGIVLGFITIKTNSIIPAMLIHFCNNGLSAIATISGAFATEKVTNIVYYSFFLMWLILAVAAVPVLARRNWGVKKNETVLNDVKYTNPYLMSTSKKIGTFFSTVPMIISLIILIVLTAGTVSIAR